MPEMPEVETLARKLRKKLIGKEISRVLLSGLPLRRPIDGDFARKLRGRTIRSLTRRGKYLVAEMHPEAFWIIHLGMSGRVLYHTDPTAGTKHTHVQVRFKDSTELEYRDPRRFGLMDVYEVATPDQIPELRTLGRDPLRRGFNAKWMESQLRRCRQEIKSFLLDQRKISGLGNIYACESLFLASIHPRRRCYTLTGPEAARLTDSVRETIRNAVCRHGTSFSDFVDSDGIPGQNQNFLAVFQRDGQECIRCGMPIQRIVQANRGTFYCHNCQN
jgi:formamidopyrimidine-DNA glycosylase